MSGFFVCAREVMSHPDSDNSAASSAPLPLDDRGLQFGHGLFETVRVVDGVAPLLERHIARAAEGLQRLALPVDEVTLRGWFGAAVAAAQGGSAALKVIVTAGGGGAGYCAPAQWSPRCRYRLMPLPAGVAEQRRDGVRLWRCRYQLPINPPLAGIKHLNRLDQLLARAEWHDPAYAEGLVCSRAGDVVEATAANLFVRTASGWVTPLTDRCGVRGVMRDYLLDELFPAHGVAVAERAVAASELQAASELLVCNALRGIVPVVGLNSGEQWPVGEQTRQLQRGLAAALPGYRLEGGDED